MKNPSKTMQQAFQPTPFHGEIGTHPFGPIVEQYLESRGLDPREHRRQIEGEAVWSFVTESGLTAFYRIYADQHGEVFVHLEAAFGFVPEVIEEAILAPLLYRNSLCHMPMCYGLNEDRLAIVVFRTYALGITPEHFLIRLASIVEYAELSREEFSKPQYGLQPLPLKRMAAAA